MNFDRSSSIRPSYSHLSIYSSLSSINESEELTKHVQVMNQLLEQLIPEREFFEDKNDLLTWLNEQLPLVKWKEPTSPPDCLNVYLLCRSSKEIPVEAFFRHALIRGLSSEKSICFLSLHHLDFYMQEAKGEMLFIAEAKVLIETDQQYSYIKKILPSLAKEIAFGVCSSKYASNILDSKPFLYDLKIALMHEKILEKIRKYPRIFDEELLEEMSRFLALSDKEFRLQRSAYHLSELICAQYLVKNNLIKALRFSTDKRHLFVRFLRTRLHFTFGSKSVLGVIISLNLQDMQEIFGEKHILQAVQKFLPSAQSVKSSLYIYQKHEEMMQIIYLELEKKEGGKFSSQELRLFKRNIGEEFKERIEKLSSSVFMVGNEEEIMKNIVTLGKELKSPSDLPQVIVRFEEQTTADLIFSAIIVHAIRKNSLSQFFSSLACVHFSVERCQIIGNLDEQHLKEANVLRFYVPKGPDLLRSDFSVNLHLARQKVLAMIIELIGEVRDYTGGMISEQEKQYYRFQQLFPEIAKDQVKLLEDFFYSLTPIEAQCILPLASLQFLFSEFLVALQALLSDKKSYYLKIKDLENQIYIVLKADPSLQQIIQQCLEKCRLSAGSFASSFVIYKESLYLSFIYFVYDKKEQEAFITNIQEAIQIWQTKLQSQKVLRLSSHDLRTILDPRLGGGDREFSVILRMLYDGLTRIDPNGKPQLSIAKAIEISDDKKRYLFKLRNCLWSNGSAVVAYDFEYTWKRILHPHFKSPFSSLLYPIKNAKAIKEGSISMDNLGVRSLDEKTLLVDLEFPTPYFLELTANAFYSPVNHMIDQLHPNWTSQFGQSYVCNGPFLLKKRSSKQYELEKNPYYWDAESVHLDQIIIYKTDPYDALAMFTSGKIDWLGRPLRPWEPFYSKTLKNSYHPATSMVHWCVFNVEIFPFNHLKIRQALASAICRQEIIQAISTDLISAHSPLPQEHSQFKEKENYEENKVKAITLFNKALEELGIKKENFPILTLICLKGNIRENTALMLKKQWEELLGIYCRIEAHDWHTLFDKMTQGDYQIGGMTWKSLFNDPIYTFNAFKYRNDQINFSKWENQEYKSLLDMIERESCIDKRNEYFAQAEAILMKELPLIPIYYEIEKFTKRNDLQVPLNSAQIDFKWVHIKDKSKKEDLPYL
jgi:ABC-type oligopeptide transport system substrate-binding subunit